MEIILQNLFIDISGKKRTLKLWLNTSILPSQSTGVGSVRSIIWSRSGNHGATWKIARVSVSAGSGRQVTFEGVTGSGFAGDIAIDDIKMIPGNCPPPGKFQGTSPFLSMH